MQHFHARFLLPRNEGAVTSWCFERTFYQGQKTPHRNQQDGAARWRALDLEIRFLSVLGWNARRASEQQKQTTPRKAEHPHMPSAQRPTTFDTRCLHRHRTPPHWPIGVFSAHRNDLGVECTSASEGTRPAVGRTNVLHDEALHPPVCTLLAFLTARPAACHHQSAQGTRRHAGAGPRSKLRRRSRADTHRARAYWRAAAALPRRCSALPPPPFYPTTQKNARHGRRFRRRSTAGCRRQAAPSFLARARALRSQHRRRRLAKAASFSS